MKKIYYYHKVLTLFILFCTLLMSTISYGQYYKRGFVPIQWPQGGFSVDGDAYQNTNIYINCAPDSLNRFGDWFYYASYPYPTYPGGSIFNQAGDTISASPIWARIANYIDNFKTNDQSVFAQSNKINDNPNTYNVKPGNVPPKDDMERATAAFSYGDPTLTGHSVGLNPTSFVGDPNDLWVVFAADRWQTNGNSYMDFEFNQKAIIWNQVDGSFTTLADPFYNGVPTGGRTPGDLLVTIQFEQGGTKATLYVDLWELKPDGSGYQWTTKNVDADLPAMEDPSIGWKVELANYKGSMPHSHTKFIVIDGKTVMAAGFNIAWTHLPEDNPSGKGESLTDLGVVLTGPVAQTGIAAFDDEWLDSNQLICGDLSNRDLEYLENNCTWQLASVSHLPESLKYYLPGDSANAVAVYRTSVYKESDQAYGAALASAQKTIDVIHVNFTADLICDLNLLVPTLCNYDNTLAYLHSMIDAMKRSVNESFTILLRSSFCFIILAKIGSNKTAKR